MKPIDIGYWLLVLLSAALASCWYIDRNQIKRDLSQWRQAAIKWQCKFEAIDPIRWEAELPMSECCR